MIYVVLKNEETGEIEKSGRFASGKYPESLNKDGDWEQDVILNSQQNDGLLEEVSSSEAKLIARQISRKLQKIAA
ncbi:MAG: hypothetical protein ACR2F2_07155 [Pyrinomonadaceae bacterium]